MKQIKYFYQSMPQSQQQKEPYNAVVTCIATTNNGTVYVTFNAEYKHVRLSVAQTMFQAYLDEKMSARWEIRIVVVE